VRSFWASPYLHIRSAEPGSGKTQLLEVLAVVVRRAEMAADFSPAVLYRIIDEHPDLEPPTLLIDETDAIFSTNGKGELGERADALRGIINSGYKRSGRAVRCVGPQHDIRRFPTYSAKALAGLKLLPHTIRDRAIPIRLEKMRPGERIADWDGERLETIEAPPVREALAAWAETAKDDLHDLRPAIPDGLSPRGREIWKPLLAVAEHAAGSWPERIRSAARLLSEVEVDDESTGVQLLVDIRRVYDEAANDWLTTADLIDALGQLEESPWGSWHRGPPRAPISPRALGMLLKPFGVKPLPRRIVSKTLRGYAREAFEDAWERYAPASDDSTRNTRNIGPTKPKTTTIYPQQTPFMLQVEISDIPRNQADVAGVADRNVNPVEEAFLAACDELVSNGEASWEPL
jgi:hypothetical protein